MQKNIIVEFDNDGIEKRSNMSSCYIKIGDISSIIEFDDSWTSRITLNNGQILLVDGAADILYDVKHARKKAIEEDASSDPVLNDLHHFWLVKEERSPQSWLGRLFADAAQLIKRDDDPLPPLRVTHANGRKLTRIELREIYVLDGSVREKATANPPSHAP